MKYTKIKKILALALCCWSTSLASHAGGDGRPGKGYFLADTLRFIEPTIVGVELFEPEYLYIGSQWDGQGGRRPDIQDADHKEWSEYLEKYTGEKSYSTSFWYPAIDSSETFEEWAEKSFPETNDEIGQWKKDLYAYVKFTRKVEKVVEPFSHASWSREQKVKGGLSEMKKAMEEGYQHCKNHNLDDLIRAKYAFHTVRMAMYLEDYGMAYKAYNAGIGNNKISSITRYRALGYKARILYLDGEIEESLKAYLNIFNQCLPMRNVALWSIKKVSSREQHKKLIDSMDGGHRKAVAMYAYSLRANRDYSAGTLKEMLRIAPKEAQTEALMVRMIKALESDNSVHDSLFMIGAKNRKSGHYSALIELCKVAAVNPDIRTPAFWMFTGAYLALRDGDEETCQKMLGDAKKEKSRNASMTGQIHLLETLLKINLAEKIDEELLARIDVDLTWTEKKYGVTAILNSEIHHSILALLGQKFLVLGDIPRAILTFDAAGGPYRLTSYGYSSGFYANQTPADFLMDVVATDEEIRSLLSLLKGKQRQNFNANDLMFMMGIREIRNENFSSAKEIFKELQNNLLQKNQKHELFRREIKVTYRKEDRRVGGSAIIEQSLGEYAAYMEELMEKLKAARKNDKKNAALMAYEAGNVFFTHEMSWWSTRRNPEYLLDPAKTSFTYTPKIIEVYPLNVPQVTGLFLKKLNVFYKVGRRYRRAKEFFREVVDSGAMPELGAKSMVLLGAGHGGFYGDNAAMAEMKNKFEETEFYKAYRSSCNPLRKFDPKPGDPTPTATPLSQWKTWLEKLSPWSD